MPQLTRAKILRVHVSAADKYDGKPLYEAIVSRCREMSIGGATVFEGLEGFGETAAIHRRHLIGGDQPVVIVVVDSPENIDRIAPVIEAMIGTGVIAISDAEMTRVQKHEI
jgi:PII-like signaling protein